MTLPTISRRAFLIQLGFGTYEMLRSANSFAAPFPTRRRRGSPKKFKPIAPSAEDRLIVPAGYRYDIVASLGDSIGSKGPLGPESFGADADFTAYFPIDALTGGENANDGLLWVNHEFFNSLLVSGVASVKDKTEAHIRSEKLVVGGSLLHIRRGGGKWKLVRDADRNFRFTSEYPEIEFSGPVKEVLQSATGTLANCSGGKTPWHTALSCEENFQLFNTDVEPGLGWGKFKDLALDERKYGWVVEIDPFQKLPPRKLSCLGRFSHENVAWKLGKNNRIVLYMGDDSKDQYVYKFVSSEKYVPGKPREESRKLLESGTLYAANFAKGQWLALDIETNPKLKQAGFKTQAEVLMETRRAAAAVGATPMDRPEDCEIHPLDGSVYIAFTNNMNHGNAYGQIVRLVENADDGEATDFRYEIFLAGGPQSGLAAPDNLCFDKKGGLWVCCDMASAELGRGAYQTFANNGVFYVPTHGKDAGDAYQFASGPVDAELTGAGFNPKEDTLFLSVQHPGEGTRDLKAPTSRWPKGGGELPKSSVVAITGF
jgi:uncharacterized protein